MTLCMPEGCPRNRECTPLSRIDSTNGFICVGIHQDRPKVEQDRYAHCWKNGDVDFHDYWDRRDLVFTASVLSSAVAMITEFEVQLGRANDDLAR